MRPSFKYRLYPNKTQQQVIENTLEHCRLLYNQLLAERKEAYEKSGQSMSYVAQANSFPVRKAAIPALHSVHSQVLQDDYAVFSCEVAVVSLPPSEAMMGGDRGIKHLPVMSDGECFDHPQSLRKAERKRKRLQRAVSRKKKGSRRRKKAVRRLAKAQERVANQRRDAAHQIARHLVRTYGLIAFEDLNTQGLLKNHHLAKSIADAEWHQLVQVTTYKAERAGRRVVLVDPRFTSQDCSTPHCTYLKTDLILADGNARTVGSGMIAMSMRRRTSCTGRW